MKPEEAVAQLDALTSDDPMIAHGRADNILCEALRADGRHEIVDAYIRAGMRVGFWYS